MRATQLANASYEPMAKQSVARTCCFEAPLSRRQRWCVDSRCCDGRRCGRRRIPDGFDCRGMIRVEMSASISESGSISSSCRTSSWYCLACFTAPVRSPAASASRVSSSRQERGDRSWQVCVAMLRPGMVSCLGRPIRKEFHGGLILEQHSRTLCVYPRLSSRLNRVKSVEKRPLVDGWPPPPIVSRESHRRTPTRQRGRIPDQASALAPSRL